MQKINNSQAWIPIDSNLLYGVFLHRHALHYLLSHTIILLCSTHILFSFNTLFTLSIHSIIGLPHTSHIRSYYSLHQPVLLHSLHVSETHTFVTPVLLCTSFITQIMCVTPHILLRHLISITFNLFSFATAILNVSTPYSAVI